MRAEFLQEMVDSVGVGVGAYGADGEFRYVNEAYSSLFGVEPDDLVGVAVWGVNEAFDAERFEGYWESFSPGETRTAEAIHEYGGAAVEVETLTTRVSIGDTAYNIGTIKDITRRKARERQLSQLHNVTRDLIEADSTDEIAEITARTAEDVLDYENTTIWLLDNSGRLQPTALTERTAEVFDDHPGYPVGGDAPIPRAYESGEQIIVDDVTTRDDDYDRGKARSVMYLPLGNYGVVSIAHHEVGVFGETDVDLASILVSNAETALRRLESEQDQKRQNQRLEAFVDVISHDIPNHLNVAETRLELARSAGDEHLDHVETAHDRIGSLITDMRTLVDQGKQLSETDWYRLGDIAQGCLTSCLESEQVATLDVRTEGYVKADKSRLKQLFENLFWNALEYAGAEPTITVGLLDGGFYVEDDGPGIPPAERERVLTPGFTTAEEGHSGFGLAIVREIARAHGWSVEIVDGEAGGARFEFTDVAVRPE